MSTAAPAASSAPSTPSAPSAPVPESGAGEPKGSTESKSVSSSTPATSSSDGKQPHESAMAAVERKFKVKINGAEQEVSEKELLEGYQTRKAADEKFREAAMTRKQAEDFINLLKQDPAKVLTDPRIGVDARKWAEEFLLKQLEEEMLDPKEKELRKYKQQLEQLQAAEKQQKEAQEAARNAELTAKYTEEYTKDITSALETSGLPKNEATVRRMAHYMRQALSKGLEITAKEAVQLVKEEYTSEQKQLVSSLDGEALIAFLGPELANKIRKYDLAKLKNPAANAKTPEKQPESDPSKPKAKPKVSKDDWRERMERIKRGEE